MDYINFKELLGMTDQLEEIKFMREWDMFLRDEIGTEKYLELTTKFARQKTGDFLRGLGASEEEIEDANNYAEESMKRDGLL